MPEGIEGRVAHKGSVAAMIHQLVGGLRAGMGYCGCADIPTLQREARADPRHPAGLREGHVHDVIITKGSAELSGRVGAAARRRPRRTAGRQSSIRPTTDPPP